MGASLGWISLLIVAFLILHVSPVPAAPNLGSETIPCKIPDRITAERFFDVEKDCSIGKLKLLTLKYVPMPIEKSPESMDTLYRYLGIPERGIVILTTFNGDVASLLFTKPWKPNVAPEPFPAAIQKALDGKTRP